MALFPFHLRNGHPLTFDGLAAQSCRSPRRRDRAERGRDRCLRQLRLIALGGDKPLTRAQLAELIQIPK